jgi:hypothetical protein
VKGERLHAFEQLLAQRDERALRGRRGHRLTQTGRRDRFDTWVTFVRVWTARRLATSVGSADGWMPARHTAPRSRFARMS